MKTIMKKLVLVLIGLFISIILLEIGLRVFPIEQRIKGEHIKLPVNKDYSSENKNISKVDPYITHRKNSIGFRGTEPPNDFRNYITIITVGGSTTECNYVSDGNTWTDRTGVYLKNNFKLLWWNNAGLDGHSTFGHIFLMKDYIIKIKPNVVIFLIGINDIGLDDVSKHDLENVRDGLNFKSINYLYKSIAQYSEVASLSLNIYRYLRAVREKYTDREVNFQKELEGMKPWTDEDILKEKTNHQKKYLPGYVNRINLLIKLSKENGMIPVFLTQPAMFGEFFDNNTSLDFSKSKHKWEILELYNDTLRKCCREKNVFCVDMARKMPQNTMYYYDWMHYTNEGSSVFAKILYENLVPYLNSQN